jgi:hypothetical protein
MCSPLLCLALKATSRLSICALHLVRTDSAPRDCHASPAAHIVAVPTHFFPQASTSQLEGKSEGYQSISTNSVSLEGKVNQMLKKVKAIKRDFENLEADYKTQAHRQISIELKPRGDKGPTGILSSVHARSSLFILSPSFALIKISYFCRSSRANRQPRSSRTCGPAGRHRPTRP